MLYAPVLSVSLGAGMLIPVLPLYLRHLGFNYQTLTIVLSAAGVGALLAQLPAGTAVARWGEARVALAATAALAASIALVGVVSTILILATLCLITGVGSATWLLTRFTVMSTRVVAEQRGRVASTFGGVVRAGRLIGAVTGGFAAARFGFTAAFVLAALVTLTGVIPLLAARPDEDRPDPVAVEPRASLGEVIRSNRSPLGAAGAVQFIVVAVREGRLVVIPLLGAALGLDVASVGLLVAVGAASDLLLFPFSGWLMDGFGRLAASVPAISILTLGLAIAAWADSTIVLMVGAALAGVGNGLGAGILITIQGDLAPVVDAARFLGLVGVARDVGRVVGPLAVGFVADWLGLAAGASLLVVGGFFAIGLLVLVLGDTSDGSTRIG